MNNCWAICLLCWLNTAAGKVGMYVQDISAGMSIGPSDTGYEAVTLQCLEDAIRISFLTSEDFSGVIYTRGNFYDQKPPCFLNAESGTDFTLEFPIDGCNTREEAKGIYNNTVLLQHDDLLIMPGDGAFIIKCEYASDINEGKQISATIGLADPDPGSKPLPKHRQSLLTNTTGQVTFTPDDIRPRKRKKTPPKDEL